MKVKTNLLGQNSLQSGNQRLQNRHIAKSVANELQPRTRGFAESSYCEVGGQRAPAEDSGFLLTVQTLTTACSSITACPSVLVGRLVSTGFMLAWTRSGSSSRNFLARSRVIGPGISSEARSCPFLSPPAPLSSSSLSRTVSVTLLHGSTSTCVCDASERVRKSCRKVSKRSSPFRFKKC